MDCGKETGKYPLLSQSQHSVYKCITLSILLLCSWLKNLMESPKGQVSRCLRGRRCGKDEVDYLCCPIPLGENSLHSCLDDAHVVWEEHANRICLYYYSLAFCVHTPSPIGFHSLALTAWQGDFKLLTPSRLKSVAGKNKNINLVVRIRVTTSQN